MHLVVAFFYRGISIYIITRAWQKLKAPSLPESLEMQVRCYCRSILIGAWTKTWVVAHTLIINVYHSANPDRAFDEEQPNHPRICEHKGGWPCTREKFARISSMGNWYIHIFLCDCTILKFVFIKYIHLNIVFLIDLGACGEQFCFPSHWKIDPKSSSKQKASNIEKACKTIICPMFLQDLGLAKYI